VIEQPRYITKEQIEKLRLPHTGNNDLSSIPVYEMVNGHMLDCAIHDEGPCTCGTEEELEAIAREEAGED